MSSADLIVSCLCEAKPKDIEGRHHTPGWLGRVPKEDVPAVVRFLKSQGVKPRVIYRDKSTDRPKRYARGRYFVSGWAHKSDATHADIYDPGPSGYGRDTQAYLKIRNEAAMLNAIKVALNGKKTKDPEVIKLLVSKPEWAFAYAKNAIKGEWPEGEATIAKDPHWAYEYAKNVIKGPWTQGEPVLRNSDYWPKYIKMVNDYDPETGSLYTGEWL